MTWRSGCLRLVLSMARQPPPPPPSEPQPPHYRGYTITLRVTPQSVGLLWTSDHPTQRPIPDNTQHTQQRDRHACAGFEPAIPISELPQTHDLGRAATGFITFAFCGTKELIIKFTGLHHQSV